MSETKRLEGRPESYVIYGSTGIGNVACLNSNPYPVEVTVRRVAEKVVYDGAADYTTTDFRLILNIRQVLERLREAGFAQGQRYRVTVEPLD